MPPIRPAARPRNTSTGLLRRAPGLRSMSAGALVAALFFGPVAVAAAQDGAGRQPPPDGSSELTEINGGAAGASEDPAIDIPPANSASLAAAWAQYASELFDVDLDDDGVVDIADTDGDGIPEVLSGPPGERDLPPGDPGSLIPGSELDAVGYETIVSTEVAAGDLGSDLIGDCSGMAMSFDGDGELLDWALGIGSNNGGGPRGQLVDLHGDGQVGSRAFTQENPFQVGDTVVYVGNLPQQGQGPLEHNWRISTAGISVDKGGDPNEDGKNRNAGQVNLADQLPEPIRPAGIFPMAGELTSENDLSCDADGWIELVVANPLLTAPSAVAALLGIGGATGLFFNSRPARTWKV